jgi:solute carrier family 9B (sodium/hydrogen exchanger), member 1/2
MPFNVTVVLILLGGWFAGRIFSRTGLPSVLGMVIWGITIGILFRQSLPPILFQLEPFLKSFALIVILLRAGLGINRNTLSKAGLTAVLMTCVPCLIEGSALTVAFHFLFGFEWTIAGLTGFMLAAVSPAVIVPSMLDLKNKGYGRENEVPTIILAGASADDVLAITIFTVFLQLTNGESIAIGKILLSVPVALLLGIVPGIIVGLVLVWIFRKHHTRIRASEKVLVVLMISVMLVQIGDWMHGAALLGVMTVGFVLLEKAEPVAHELSHKLSKLWIAAEIILFVLIGISVDPRVALGAGLRGLAVILIGLVFRSVGVLIATQWSDLSFRERIFCMIAYLPKATVQAALGGVALAHGVAHGEIILAIAVLAILFTAPLGLIGIRYFGKRLLSLEFPERDPEADPITAG